MKKKRIIYLLVFLVVLIFCVFFLIQKNHQLNEEIKILQEMKIDEEDLNKLYTEKNIDNKWLDDYRNIGLRFFNYLCDYGGDEKEIKNLIKLYQNYGEEIILITDDLEKGEVELALIKIEHSKETAQIIEEELNRLYGKYN